VRGRLAASESVVTVPGLTATLECFTDRTPVWFLPPQNFSQWCILKALRRAGAAEGALHWEDLGGTPRLDAPMESSESDPVVKPAIVRLLGDPDAFGALVHALGSVGADAATLVPRQRAFLESLGPSGIATVADGLRTLLDRRARGAADPTAGAEGGLGSWT
jgi:hypothetical protein